MGHDATDRDGSVLGHLGAQRTPYGAGRAMGAADPVSFYKHPALPGPLGFIVGPLMTRRDLRKSARISGGGTKY